MHRCLSIITFVLLLCKAHADLIPPGQSSTVLNHPEKVGIGVWDDHQANLSPNLMARLGVSWYYNWLPTPTEEYTGDAEFIPMIWGSTFVTEEHLEAAGKATGNVILGFNEPDHSDQAAMSVDDAIELWPKLQATAIKYGKRLGSPAPAGDALSDWFEEFMSKADALELKVDFICLHPYNFNTIEEVESHLTDVYKKYGRPIWITEFAQANWEDQSVFDYVSQAEWLRKVASLCDRLEFVERTAWFGMWNRPDWQWRVGAFDTDSALTPIGEEIREITGHCQIDINFSQSMGNFRPLHGVNMGPICYRGTVDVSDYHREISVPYTRLHDVVWVNSPAVDISEIFRDFRDAPEDPTNYDFAATDDYVASVINVDSEIIYRLGESIEHTPRKYRVHPPDDPEKWADICLGIIRHYNEGWGNGFHHNIKYWEIWNEPDNRPAMWTGDDATYFKLYEITAKAIKTNYPDLKVGGPGLGNVGGFNGEAFEPTPFLKNFLDHCRSTETPIDFFSWHRYTADPEDLSRYAFAVRDLLDNAGFSDAESHLNEWNYLPDNDWSPLLKEGQGKSRSDWFSRIGGAEGAAFAAYTLMSLQDAPVDIANYFSGDVQGFGLFDFEGTPKKNFHAFDAFASLLKTPMRVSVTVDGESRTFACAGLDRDQTQASVLISRLGANTGSIDVDFHGLPWSGSGRAEVFRIDGETMEITHEVPLTVTDGEGKLTVDLRNSGVVLIKLRRGDFEAQ